MCIKKPSIKNSRKTILVEGNIARKSYCLRLCPFRIFSKLESDIHQQTKR